VSARVELRDFRCDDAGAVHRWFNDRTATEGLLEQRDSFSEREAADWVERALGETGEDRKWAVVVDGSAEASGFVALYGIGRQIAPELGVLIADPGARGRGVGRTAIRMTAKRAFELGAHRVYARILTRNEASQRAFESVGFRHEGTLRDHVRRGDELLDVEMWGLLPEDVTEEEG
jgi:[ribosomal protein S5]-alanine N-acetyltransferase